MSSFQGFEIYGGATITRVIDRSEAEYIGCTAKRQSDNRFGFTIFRNGVEIPYAPFCTGRGSLSADGQWIATDGKSYQTGAIPGFIVGPSISGADPIPVPPSGALAALYTGVYQAQDFDTPQETATRVQKVLDAVQELETLLKQAGVLA